MNNLLQLFKLLLCITLVVSFTAEAQTFTVDPGHQHQRVVFGGDGKLTIRPWANGNVDLTSERLFGDMNLRILRVPIFALVPISDPLYDDVIEVIQAVQSVNPDVKIFASVANGNGTTDNSIHGAAKFPPGWRGCCPNNVYQLNLAQYASYLDSFMTRMNEAGITIDYLGPWNEDPAVSRDHNLVFNQMDNLGDTQRVGLEAFALNTSIGRVNAVEDASDITGSHFYDDTSIPQLDWEDRWRELFITSANPVWYTEATRYTTADGLDRLVAGMENIFPAINSGAESIIFYQVVRRFVQTNGNTQPIKYSGFRAIVNATADTRVVESSTSDENIQGVAFSNGERAEIFLLNRSSFDRGVQIRLENGYAAGGQVRRWRWDANSTEALNSFTLNGNKQWISTVPANGFIRLQVPLTRDQ